MMYNAVMKLLSVSVLLILLYSVSVSNVEAHRDGCHAAHSCPSDTGSYVCGDTGNSSQCGGSAPAAPIQQNTAPTTAPVKQFVAPIATSVPTRIPTKIPTATPTIKPTVVPTKAPTPIKKAEIKPTPKVAGESSSGSPIGGLITTGILGGLGYFGYKKIKNRKSSV